MKYVWIFAAVVMLVRIDLVMNFIEKTFQKINSKNVAPISSSEVISDSEIIPLDKDASLKTSPRKTFLSILNDFQNSPDATVKERALDLLRTNPSMFNEILDKDLEAGIYGMRNLLIQRSQTTYELLIEMMKTLKGENLVMLKKFFSFVIDIDMLDFLTIYSKTPDINCLIIDQMGDNLPVEEVINELTERLTALEALLGKEKIDPLVKGYGQRCLIVLKLQLDKLKGVTSAQAAPAPQPLSAPEAGIDP